MLMLLFVLLAPSATTVQLLASVDSFICYMLPLGMKVASALAKGGDEDFRNPART